MRRSLSAVLAALCLLPWTPAACAQDAPPAGPAAAPPSLAQALAQAEVSRDTVYLAVAADRVTPPRDMPPLPTGAPVPQVAGAYARLVQAWQTAAAVAPPTMTVLNTDPGTPNPYEGVMPGVALKLLLGGLDDGQWQALTGDQGLGYGALTDQSQRDLFLALFPGDTLAVQPQGEYDPQQAIKLNGDDLRQARLRLSQQVNIMLPVAGSPNSHIGIGTDFDSGKTRYAAGQVFTMNTGDTLYGVQVRATVPNAPKPSDLDPAAMTAPVSLAGVRTVGDLVGRIGATTHTELYADVRYEKRGVTLVGPPSARAGDLLRALALCVCGTYRRVGPAYVLTDDLIGLGARQMLLSRFARRADMARSGAEAAAGDRLFGRGGVLALPPTEPGLGVTAAEAEAQGDSPFGGDFGSPGSVQVPFSQLTPQQQDAARREFQKFQQQRQSATSSGQSSVATLDGPVMLQPQPVMQILSPAVPGPVTLNQVGLEFGFNNRLFQPSAKHRQQINAERQAQWQKQAAADAAKNPTPAPAPPPPSPAALLAPIPRRAVLASPRTAKDVDALVASMRKIGLNQLWLDVFSQGHSHLDGKPDILTEALAKTKGAGIAVIPALSLLTWDADAPEGAADRTVLGETSAQADDDQKRYQAVTGQGKTAEEADALPPSQALSACPAAPAVVDTLTALVQRLAATPGVAAIALRDTATSGYSTDGGGSYGGGSYGDDLGYTVPLRLACLRRAHVDPIDLGVSLSEPVGSRSSLPDFETEFWQMTPGAQSAGQTWNAVRAGADLDLMRRLLAAAQTSAGRRLPFLVKQRGASWTADWWGLWDDPRAPLPVLAQQAIGTVADDGFAAYAHSQCRVDVYALPPVFTQSPGGLAFALQQMKPGWDGVVIDASDTSNASDALAGDPLAALAVSLPPPVPAKHP